MRTLSLSLALTIALPLAAQRQPVPPLDKAVTEQFQAAYSAYQAGHYPDSAAQLEALEKKTPNSFEVHELLGLTYAAERQDKKAIAQFKTAVQLDPKSAAARNNLATSLVHDGQFAPAENEWRLTLKNEPDNYEANRNLARLYLQQGRLSAAIPLLVSAGRIRPAAQDNAYDLALAYLLTENLQAARELLTSHLQKADSGELHSLLGRVDEKEQRYVDAVKEFSLAAHLDPSEENLFVWASELMAHRAYQPAIEVFQQGTQRFPASPRLWVGLGMALYSRGEYQPSIRSLLTAADLSAEDPRCYYFLSKAYLSSPSMAEQVIDRFRRYAELRPKDSLAQYYYAMSIWKGRRVNTPEIDYQTVETLLQKSIALDERNVQAHLQLGILYNDQHQYDKALPQYQRALAIDPDLADAHFRLGRYYLRAGEKEKADAELERFKQLQAQHQAQVDKERAEVQQFVVASTGSNAAQP